MPVSLPAEFRQRAVELARSSHKPLAEVAKELGIGQSCLQTWVRQAKTDENGSATQLTKRRGYCEWRSRPKSAREQDDELLLKHIRCAHAE